MPLDPAKRAELLRKVRLGMPWWHAMRLAFPPNPTPTPPAKPATPPRHDVYDDLSDGEAVREAGPRQLPKANVQRGGICEKDNGKGQAAEMRRLREEQAFGRVGGIAGVLAVKPRRLVTKVMLIDGKIEIRQEMAGGLPLDVMLKELQADGRWPWLESIDDLTNFLDDVQKHGLPESGQDEAAVLKGMGMDPATAWWETPLGPQAKASDVAEGDGDQSLEVSSFESAPPVRPDDQLVVARRG